MYVYIYIHIYIYLYRPNIEIYIYIFIYIYIVHRSIIVCQSVHKVSSIALRLAGFEAQHLEFPT